MHEDMSTLLCFAMKMQIYMAFLYCHHSTLSCLLNFKSEGLLVMLPTSVPILTLIHSSVLEILDNTIKLSRSPRYLCSKDKGGEWLRMYHCDCLHTTDPSQLQASYVVTTVHESTTSVSTHRMTCRFVRLGAWFCARLIISNTGAELSLIENI